MLFKKPKLIGINIQKIQNWMPSWNKIEKMDICLKKGS